MDDLRGESVLEADAGRRGPRAAARAEALSEDVRTDLDVSTLSVITNCKTKTRGFAVWLM